MSLTKWVIRVHSVSHVQSHLWGLLTESLELLLNYLLTYISYHTHVSTLLVKLNFFLQVKFQVLWFPAIDQRYKYQVDSRLIITQRYWCVSIYSISVSAAEVFPCLLPTAYCDTMGREKGHLVPLRAVYISCHLYHCWWLIIFHIFRVQKNAFSFCLGLLMPW